MFKSALAACLTIACTSDAFAQEVYYGQPGSYAAPVMVYGGQESIGSGEPLFAYDDLEPWKHGYLHVIPCYEGLHSFRPHNYKQILAQSQTAAIWGMPNTMPYSQQFWHRYEQQADLSAQRMTSHPDPRIDLQPSPGSTAQDQCGRMLRTRSDPVNAAVIMTGGPVLMPDWITSCGSAIRTSRYLVERGDDPPAVSRSPAAAPSAAQTSSLVPAAGQVPFGAHGWSRQISGAAALGSQPLRRLPVSPAVE